MENVYLHSALKLIVRDREALLLLLGLVVDENGGSESASTDLLHDLVLIHARLHRKSNLFLKKKKAILYFLSFHTIFLFQHFLHEFLFAHMTGFVRIATTDNNCVSLKFSSTSNSIQFSFQDFFFFTFILGIIASNELGKNLVRLLHCTSLAVHSTLFLLRNNKKKEIHSYYFPFLFYLYYYFLNFIYLYLKL